MGLRSTTLSVLRDSFQLDLGLTSIQHSTTLRPDENPDLGASAVLESVERRRPQGSPSTVTVEGDELKIEKVSDDETERSIFEVLAQASDRSNSVLAQFTVRFYPDDWAVRDPTWTNKTNVAPPFIGVEHGGFNTGVFLFFRDNGAGGSVIIAGPQTEAGQERQGLVEVSYPWLAFDDAEAHTFWIHIDASSKIVTVYSDDGGDGSTPSSVLTSQTIGSFGEFPISPAPGSTNTRLGYGPDIRLFLGNSGRDGDVIFFPDWALFSDYRSAVIDGRATANHDLRIRPESPHTFDPRLGDLPTERLPGLWKLEPDSTQISTQYAPGNPYAPEATKLSKSAYGQAYLWRSEPRIGALDSGFVVEAYMKVDVSILDDGITGVGVSVDDGEKIFSIRYMSGPSGKSIWFGSSLTEVDLSEYVLVRLVYDRLRGKVNLFIDGELKLSVDDSTFGNGDEPAVRVGFLENSHATGDVYLRLIRYLTRYFAWEGLLEDGSDGALPDDSGLPSAARFSLEESGTGDSTIEDGNLVLWKEEYADEESKRFYTRAADFLEGGGAFLEFAAKVDSYTNDTGGPSPGMAIGAGVTIHLGDKKIVLGFYDCGTGGRKIGIVPGSGSESDIIDGSALGLRFSTPADWGTELRYRLELVGGDSIRLWVSDDLEAPAITIPWRGDRLGFDLPEDDATPAIDFGHFEGYTSSKVRWRYVRWGASNGFDVSVRQSYPSGYQESLFGGRVYLVSEFDEA